MRLQQDVKFNALTRDLARREALDPVPFQRLSVQIGLALDPRRLTKEERKELLRLSRRDDRVRFEALAEKAAGAGASGFFEERRQVQAAEAKLAQLIREGREAAANDVRVPGRTFHWLHDGAPQAPHSLFEIAVLATLADAFENGRLPARGAAFEGGWLVLPEDVEFVGCEWPNDPTRCRVALSRLSQNGLLRVKQDAASVRVALV